MKVFVLRPNENWICDRMHAEWHKYMDHVSTADPSEADVIWLLAGWCWNHLPVQFLAAKKVVCSVHHVDPLKFGDRQRQEFAVRDQVVDRYHVPNSKTRDFILPLTQRPIDVVGYWYDPDMWYPEDKTVCRWELGIPADAYVVGSFQRDTEGGTRDPKLAKGPDILCDYLESLQKDILHVLLGGWRREYVMDRLDAAGIDYTFHDRVGLELLRKMYNACDLYVVASRHEGGPQAILEASATRTYIISRDVGMASDVLDSSCIQDIPDGAHMPPPIVIDRNYRNVQKYALRNIGVEYVRMFERAMG